MSPLEFVLQEQSYSSLHSGRSLAWDHICGDIDDPCCANADFCGVIADPCGVVAISEAIGGVTGDIGTEFPAISVWSFRRYWCGVSGDCGVGITQQMCNTVTNHGDMRTFSKPVWHHSCYVNKLKKLLEEPHSHNSGLYTNALYLLLFFKWKH